MIVVYRRWGLAFALLGVLIGFLLLLATFSFSLPLLAMAGLWIYYGRTGTDPETGEPLPPSSVYFIPLWVWGSILLLPATLLTVFELTVGRPLALVAAAEERKQAELRGGDPAPKQLPDTPAVSVAPGAAKQASLPPVADRAGATPGPPTPPAAKPSTAAAPRPQTLAESMKVLEETRAFARKEFEKAHPEPPPPGEAVTDSRTLKPGQRLFARHGFHWSPVRVVAIAKPDTLVVHWVGYATVWDERMTIDRVRLGAQVDSFAVGMNVDKDERDLVPTRKPDRGAVMAPGMRFLCDTDDFWLPVEIVREVPPSSVRIRWVSFDSRFEETVPATRLRLPVEEPPWGSRGPIPGDAVTLLTDLDGDRPILFRNGFEWKPVKGLEALGIEHVLITDPKVQGAPRRVKRSELRVQTDE